MGNSLVKKQYPGDFLFGFLLQNSWRKDNTRPESGAAILEGDCLAEGTGEKGLGGYSGKMKAGLRSPCEFHLDEFCNGRKKSLLWFRPHRCSRKARLFLLNSPVHPSGRGVFGEGRPIPCTYLSSPSPAGHSVEIRFVPWEGPLCLIPVGIFEKRPSNDGWIRIMNHQRKEKKGKKENTASEIGSPFSGNPFSLWILTFGLNACI